MVSGNLYEEELDMESFVFFISMTVISLCALAISPALVLYLQVRKPPYLYLILLFSCILVELIEIHYIAFIGFPKGVISVSELNHITYPLLRISISLLILLLDLLILLWITGRKWHTYCLLFFLPLIAVSCYLITLPQTEFVVWLFYSIRQFYRIGYCLYFSICLIEETDDEQKVRIQSYSLLIFGIFIISCMIMLEDSLVISHITFFLEDIPIITERNFSENFLWIFISIYALFICSSKILKKESADIVLQTSADLPPDDTKDLNAWLPSLAEYYKFTPREMQILKCLIGHKSNTDICDELEISLGTVKTHTHNIYAKVNVNSRNELIRVLMAFEQERIMAEKN